MRRFINLKAVTDLAHPATVMTLPRGSGLSKRMQLVKQQKRLKKGNEKHSGLTHPPNSTDPNLIKHPWDAS